MMEEELTNIDLDVVSEILDMKSLKAVPRYDEDKLQYNNRYKCFEYFAKKFPKGWESIPGFDKVIEMCQKNGGKITPLQEMQMKQFIAIEQIDDLICPVSER